MSESKANSLAMRVTNVRLIIFIGIISLKPSTTEENKFLLYEYKLCDANGRKGEKNQKPL